jgi:hypothetical protein
MNPTLHLEPIMNSRTQTALLLALAFSTPPLLAQGTAGPPAEVSQLSTFVGDWQCTGQILAKGSRPAHATAAEGHGMNALGGHWMEFSYKEKKTSANPTPYNVAGYMGYDAMKKQYVQTIVDNYGSYGPSFSDGWKNDTLTFEGSTNTSDGKAMLMRDHFVRKGGNGFVHFTEGQGPDGKWSKPDEETCHLGK